MSDRRLLCLRCRQAGHSLPQCQATTYSSEYGWMFDKSRMEMDFKIVWQTRDPDSAMCQRCRDLDLIRLLNAYPPWTTQDELTSAFDSGHDLIRSLGLTGTTKYWEDCPVCRCLFALTPTPTTSGQQVMLLPDWTICRLSGETGIELDTQAKRIYGTCLLIVLKPSTLDSIPLPIRAHRCDAICLLDGDLEQGRTLGGRQIDQDHLDIPLIHQWLSTCSTQHGPACQPLFTPSLQKTSLVDVETKQIVSHPGHQCDYVALSYVWGGVDQRSYKVGDCLGKLPQTLEDSIIFTKRLGKKYLWADSLCIDQSNHTEKDDQIQRMRDIYHGAYLTVIAISGESADAGLPRISRSEVMQQLSCCLDGKRLVGLMPTLSQQVWVSPWGQRAWTFQESRLSPRCLLISDHQMYFECKGFQCAESLECERSMVHNLSVQSNTTNESFASWMMAQGGSGCFRHSIDMYEHRLNNYGCGLNLYSARKVKYAEDSIKAFTGMLQTFDKMYPNGFIEGIPIEDLNWGLLWRTRDPGLRREAFPSWTWAGWEGAVWYGQPIDHTKPQRCPIDLHVQRIKEDQLESIFHTRTEVSAGRVNISIIIRNDPVDAAWQQYQAEPVFHANLYSIVDQQRLLVIDCTSLIFKLDFRKPRHGQSGSGQYGLFELQAQQVSCFIQIMSTDSEVTNDQNVEKTFLLLARDYVNRFIVHYLLLVRDRPDGRTVERVTALELLVPIDNLDVLAEFKPVKRRFVLV